MPALLALIMVCLSGCATDRNPSLTSDRVMTATELDHAQRTSSDDTALRSRVREQAALELVAMLPLLQVDSPQTRQAANKIADSILRPGARAMLTHEEQAILAARANPTHAITTEWIRGAATSMASTSGTSWRIPPLVGSSHELPPPGVLRLLVVLRIDFGSVIEEQKATRGKSAYYTGETWRRIQAAREKARLNAPAFAGIITDAVAGAAEHPTLGLDGPRIAALLIGLRDWDASECDAFELAAAGYASRPNADPWLKELMLGRAATCRAWAERGGNLAGETTEEQFRLFQVSLDRAFAHLVAAHRLRPERPDAAAMLARVAMGSSNPEHLTPAYWFERAVHADRGCYLAYDALLNDALPRWGADEAEAAACMRRVADSASGSNSIGYTVIDWLPQFLEDDPEILKTPGFAAAAFDALRPYFDSIEGNIDQSLARSVAMTFAYHTKDATRVIEAYGIGDWEYRPIGLEAIRVPPRTMIRFADEQHNSYGAHLRDARAAAAVGDLDKAARCARHLLAMSELPLRLRTEAVRISGAKSLAADFNSGQEVTLVDTGTPPHFLLRDGATNADAMDGRTLRFGYVGPDADRTVPRGFLVPFPLGQRYIVTGRVRASLSNAARQQMAYGRLRLAAYAKIDAPAGGINVPVSVPRPNFNIAEVSNPMILETTFRLVADGQSSTLEVDGKTVRIMPFQVLGKETWGDWLALSGEADHPDATLELTELRIRTLERD